LAEPRTTAAPVEGKLPSVSYKRFAKSSSADLTVPEARIRADLTAIAWRVDFVCVSSAADLGLPKAETFLVKQCAISNEKNWQIP
jgi:hypothetical protein